MSTTTEAYAGFGTCPDCGGSDGYINIGRSQWFYCTEHKTRWIAGWNLFSTWQDETRQEQEATFDALDFGSYAYIAATADEARAYDQHCDEPPSNPTRVRPSTLCARCHTLLTDEHVWILPDLVTEVCLACFCAR